MRFSVLVLVMAVLAGVRAGVPASAASLASIDLYNPTAWSGPGVVEIPTGSLAAPGIVDWNNVKLVVNGKEIPFALREGTVHWKSKLAAPVNNPHAEDLLVFTCTVPASKSIKVNVVAGSPKHNSAIAYQSGLITVTYPNVKIAVDEKTGMLVGLRAYGESMLNGKLAASLFKLPGDGLKLDGNTDIRPPADVKVAAKNPMPTPVAQLVSSSSTPAMTEINFVLDSGDHLKLALTYRVHASGLVEIWSDERPWQGKSPWIDHCVEYNLPLAGEKTPAGYPLNRAPYYGFKDYAAVVRYADTVHTGQKAMILELGEYTVNGRRWNRQLFVAPADKASKAADFFTFAVEGLGVNPAPARTTLKSKTIDVTYPKGARVMADVMVKALVKAGAKAASVPAKTGVAKSGIALLLSAKPAADGILGDGFAVRADKNGVVTIKAGDLFGLMCGAQKVAKGTTSMNGIVSLPMIAGNPGVDLRSVGFGGGPFEVDFPYESDTEWEHAFDGIIDGGVNIVADLSMWGNWKMPVSYKYMPELKTDAPDAFDESSGTKFSEIDEHREHGQKLLKYLHDRGVKVWQWIPIGCVPTTYAKAHPEAMSPTNPKTPCFTDPLYAKYIQAFFKELIETYQLDGLVMVRDDNGGKCDCDRCKAYVANSRTKDAAWEQYLIIYDMLHASGFKGEIAVYPYFDKYQPLLDPLLPKDLYIVGHGSGMATLTRNFEYLGPMGDTWIDNLFAGFRLAPSGTMKRLLADRGSFWIGGAYCGTELPWESVGYFGWEPTAAVNTFRYQWGEREFGGKNAVAYMRLSMALEKMWDLYQIPMLPVDWVTLTSPEQERAAQQCNYWLGQYRTRLAELKSATKGEDHAKWFAHVELFGTYFDYNVRRLQAIVKMNDLVKANKAILESSKTLPEDARQELLSLHQGIYSLADAYGKEAAKVPGNMMKSVCDYGMCQPNREWMPGFDYTLDRTLIVPQYDGKITLSPSEIQAGKPFTLNVELRNTGEYPWLSTVGLRLDLAGDAQKLGLPSSWNFQGEPVVFGDTRVVELKGTAPAQPGEGEISVTLATVFRSLANKIETKSKLKWN